MTTTDMTTADDAEDINHISTVRRHLLDQMRALRGATSAEAMRDELERSRGVADLAQAVVNTAKVEVEYLRVTNQPSSPFMEVAPDKPYLPDATGANVRRLPGTGNGIDSITRHTLKG